MPSDKVRLVVNAAYRNGVPMFTDQTIIADSQLSPNKPDTDCRVVTLRFAMSKADAERLDHAFHTGDAELSIGEVRPFA
jgi:hypothetical protein